MQTKRFLLTGKLQKTISTSSFNKLHKALLLMLDANLLEYNKPIKVRYTDLKKIGGIKATRPILETFLGTLVRQGVVFLRNVDGVWVIGIMSDLFFYGDQATRDRCSSEQNKFYSEVVTNGKLRDTEAYANDLQIKLLMAMDVLAKAQKEQQRVKTLEDYIEIGDWVTGILTPIV
jgi:hypothetical protein